MVEKCANPSCSAIFQRLRDGRLFVMEVSAGSPGVGKKPARSLEYFWLCKTCCRTMTLTMHKETGIKVVPAKTVSFRAAS